MLSALETSTRESFSILMIHKPNYMQWHNRDKLTDYFDTLAGRAGTTPISPPLRLSQPGKAAQGKELHAHATTVLGPTRGVNPVPNLEAINHPLATYNCLDRINVLESKRSGLMHVHDQGHRDGVAALPVVPPSFRACFRPTTVERPAAGRPEVAHPDRPPGTSSARDQLSALRRARRHSQQPATSSRTTTVGASSPSSPPREKFLLLGLSILAMCGAECHGKECFTLRLLPTSLQSGWLLCVSLS